MSDSPLSSGLILADPHNYYGDRRCDIDGIIIHHAAGVISADSLCAMFQNPNRYASANYCIGNDGVIKTSVPEELCAGTTGGFNIDCHNVTIEVSNCETGGDWKISDKALESLIKLCADIAKRNPKIGVLVAGVNLTWHSMYQATACPGNYLRNNMEKIAKSANEINNKTGAKGYYAGFNIGRAENTLCVYINPLKKAPTNKWGTEVACDHNGVAVCDSVYGKGGMTIPDGGRVFSAHGEAIAFLDHIKEGMLIWIQNSRAYYNTDIHRSYDGVNVSRQKDFLILYQNKSRTGTNKWGTEVPISKNGIAGKPVYGVGNMTIPTGGAVLSGHGKNSKWLLENIKEGQHITIKANMLILR